MTEHVSNEPGDGAPVTLDLSLQRQLTQLRTELAKDILFFGTTGILIGILTLLDARLERLGIASGSSLADALLGDYASVNALGFQMVCCVLLGGIVGLLRNFSSLRSILNGIYEHVRMRLLQLASPMICMLAGVGVVSTFHAWRTGTAGGIALAFLLVLLISMVAVTYLLLAFFDPSVDWPKLRSRPRVIPAFAIVLALTSLAYMIQTGTGEDRSTGNSSAVVCNQVSSTGRR